MMRKLAARLAIVVVCLLAGRAHAETWLVKTGVSPLCPSHAVMKSGKLQFERRSDSAESAAALLVPIAVGLAEKVAAKLIDKFVEQGKDVDISVAGFGSGEDLFEIDKDGNQGYIPEGVGRCLWLVVYDGAAERSVVPILPAPIPSRTGEALVQGVGLRGMPAVYFEAKLVQFDVGGALYIQFRPRLLLFTRKLERRLFHRSSSQLSINFTFASAATATPAITYNFTLPDVREGLVLVEDDFKAVGSLLMPQPGGGKQGDTSPTRWPFNVEATVRQHTSAYAWTGPVFKVVEDKKGDITEFVRGEVTKAIDQSKLLEQSKSIDSSKPRVNK